MSIQKYLPSKQFSLFLGSAIIVGAFIFGVVKIIDSRSSVRQEIQNIATREIIEELDTDNDGVKDWEEALWGLDLDNADTDGDGVLDGQEVEERRAELRSRDEFVDVLEEPTTETEKIARQLLTVALNINQASGGKMTEEEIAAIAQGFMGSIEPQLVEMYSIGDLKINSSTTAQSYYDEMSQALAFLDEVPKNELLILEQAIGTNREKFLDELGPIIEAYAKVPEAILEKDVPSQVANYHLDYINAITQKAIALVSMAQYFKDPVIAVRGVQEYGIADENLTQAVQNITSYLKNNGIVR